MNTMKILKIAVVVCIIILLFYFVFNDVNLSDVIKHIKNINPVYPLVFAVGVFLNFIIRAYRWGIILKPYKKDIPLKTLYDFTVIGFFLNLFTGRLGEVARGILLARKEKIKKSFGLATVVLERMIDSFIIILLFLISLFFIKNSNSEFLQNLKKISLYILPVILIIFSMFYFINIKKISNLIEKSVILISKILPAKFRERAVKSVLNFFTGLKLNLSLYDFTKLFLFSIIVWLCVIPFYWFLMKGFDFGVNISLAETVPYFSILAVSATIPIPGMAGSLDAGSKLGFTELYKIPSDSATVVAYTILFHFFIVFVSIIAGFISFYRQRLNFKIIKKIKDKNEMS